MTSQYLDKHHRTCIRHDTAGQKDQKYTGSFSVAHDWVSTQDSSSSRVSLKTFHPMIAMMLLIPSSPSCVLLLTADYKLDIPVAPPTARLVTCRKRTWRKAHSNSFCCLLHFLDITYYEKHLGVSCSVRSCKLCVLGQFSCSRQGPSCLADTHVSKVNVAPRTALEDEPVHDGQTGMLSPKLSMYHTMQTHFSDHMP